MSIFTKPLRFKYRQEAHGGLSWAEINEKSWVEINVLSFFEIAKIFRFVYELAVSLHREAIYRGRILGSVVFTPLIRAGRSFYASLRREYLWRVRT